MSDGKHTSMSASLKELGEENQCVKKI